MSVPPPRRRAPTPPDAQQPTRAPRDPGDAPADRPAEEEVSAELLPAARYPWTTVYLCVMVTVILLAVLFHWKL